MKRNLINIISSFSSSNESKLSTYHSCHIIMEFAKELRAHDWLHAFADDHRTRKNGSTHIEEIREAIGWMNTNFDSTDQKDVKRMWDKYAPAQFKKDFPKNLKKFNKVPSWITKILKTKEPKNWLGDVG